jgi:DNA-binding protein H-NS
MMSYRELKEKASELDLLIREARNAEFDATLEEVRTRVKEFGFTQLEVFGVVPARRRKRLNKRPRYRDPETGIEWSGWGREPFWIKGKDRKQFEIEET